MRRIIVFILLILGMLGASGVNAGEAEAGLVQGTYLLTQADGFQRLLQLGTDGSVSQVSDQQTVLGFTSALGVWTRKDHRRVIARTIDFDYDLASGAADGSTRISYDMTFSDPKGGKYQAVQGILYGASFAQGQNPLHPSAPPTFVFEVHFTGERMSAPGGLMD